MKQIYKIIPLIAASMVIACSGTPEKNVPVEGVTLNESSITIGVNETYQLTPSFEPSNASNKNVTWSSSNTNYVSVSESGLVSALKVGNATVTVTTVDGEFKATCKVTVTKKLDSITLSNTKTEYYTGDTFSKPTVTARYSDNSTSIVSSGVTFSGYDLNTPGIQTVTASYTFSGTTKTASYSITVTELECIGIELTNVKTSYYTGDDFTKPTVTASYNSGKTSVVTNSATFSGYDMNTEGSQTVTVTYGGFTKTYSIVVTYKPSSQTGEYTLLTQSSIEVGGYIVLATTKSGSAYVMSTTQNLNNRGAVSLSVSNNALQANSSTATLKVEAGTTSGTYALYDEVNGGYLYAAGSSSSSSRENYLRITDTKSSKTDFSYSNSNGQATFISKSGAARSHLKFNSSDSIYACYKSDSRNTSYPYIFFKSGIPVYPTSISLTGASEVAINESATLTVTYEPANTNVRKVTWTSSDSSVASVSNGVVTGLKEGTTTITAKAQGENSTEIIATKSITVKRVSVTGVTLSKTSADLSLGRTLQLSATVVPSNATNKNVTWLTSNTNLATVASDGTVTANQTTTGVVTITATTEDGNKTASCTINVVEQAKDEWTILIYMCGADLESKSGLATSDIQEILKVSGQPDDVNIVIETGGASSWASTYGISSTKLERWHVENRSLVKDASLTYASMGLSSTLQSFLEFGLTDYPAEKTGLILWNHGGGMHGVCYDEKKSDDSLLDNEVKSAVSGALTSCKMTGEKLEFIGYDACLMQVQDIAEMNSPYFNYMVASEESEAGYGWDYDNWVDDLYARKSTTTILQAICDSFIADNGGVNSSSSDQTLSYLDLSKASAYKDAWEAMAAQLETKLTSSNKSSFNSAIVNNVKHFAENDYDYFCLFDAKDFVNKLASASAFSNFRVDASYTNAVLSAFSDLVVYSTAQKGAGNAYGLCMYWCNDSSYSYMSVYTTSHTNFTNWRNINQTYGTHA